MFDKGSPQKIVRENAFDTYWEMLYHEIVIFTGNGENRMAKKETYAIVLDDGIVAKLDACAEKMGISRSALIRLFCIDGIERMEVKTDYGKMTNGELMAELDDTMQKLAKASHDEWEFHPSRAKITALKHEMSRRMSDK